VENSLHPNLARLAASYQQILGRLNTGTINLAQAHVEIRELVARDDEGVQWTINPRDGGWLFLSRNGEWMPAAPPASGFATLTPHDLRNFTNEAPVAYNPDWDLSLQRVDAPTEGLVGATRRAASVTASPINRRTAVLIAGVVAVGLASLSWLLFSRDTEMLAPGPIVTVPVDGVTE
jgi:hypothetical protein